MSASDAPVELRDRPLAQSLNGKALARQIQQTLKTKIQSLQPQLGRAPGLAVLMVGDHPASAAYVRNKELACAEVGIASFGHHYPETISQQAVIDEIQRLNQNPAVDGILVQLPLPPNFDAIQLLHTIDPDKDADGLHPLNLGRLIRGEQGLRSCTPAGVMRLLDSYGINPSGKRAVVIGRSILVGKPLALMLLAADATVTMAHSRTPNLDSVIREADLVIAAIGKPERITASQIRPGATVIDVGINRVTREDGKHYLVGDVDFKSVQQVANYLTPVPGGIGPMTVTMLLHNTVWSYCRHFNVEM